MGVNLNRFVFSIFDFKFEVLLGSIDFNWFFMINKGF